MDNKAENKLNELRGQMDDILTQVDNLVSGGNLEKMEAWNFYADLAARCVQKNHLTQGEEKNIDLEQAR